MPQDASQDLMLIRYAPTPMGTFGVLRMGQTKFVYTLELPWKANEVGKSCIPVGKYPLRKTRYNRGGYESYKICDVPGRSQIKIHIGNTIKDIRGCVCMGTQLGVQGRRWGVLHSRQAFREFIAWMDSLGDEKPRFINITFGSWNEICSLQ